MATYYIKTGGNDGLSGTSEANAWATLAKVNDFSYNTGFAAGDNILFNRGDTFNIVHHVGGSSPYDDAVYNSQALYIQQSGTTGNPITIGAYGTGGLPIINGRCAVRGWNTTGNWTNTTGNIWRMRGSIWLGGNYAGRGRLWINGSEVRMADTEGGVTATQPYSHSWLDEFYLYVYSVGNPATTYSLIEDQGWSNSVAQIYGNNYQTYQNLDLRGCVHGISISGNNIIIEDCSIGLYCAMNGIYVDGDDAGARADNGIIRRCTLETGDTQIDQYYPAGRPNTEDGIIIRDDCDNWDVYDNILTNWSHASLGIYAIEGDGGPVTNIFVHDNFVSSPNVDYSLGLAAAGGVGKFTNIQVYNNHFYDIPNEIQLYSKGIKFYNNIIDKITGVQWDIYTDNERFGNGVVISCSSMLDTDPEEIEIYNNTIVNCNGAGIAIRNDESSDKKHNLIRNNLLYNNNLLGDVNYAPYDWRFQLKIFDEYPVGNTNTILDNTYQNNIMYYAGTTDLVFNGRDLGNNYFYTPTEFNAYSGVRGDIISDNFIGDVSANMFIDFGARNYRLKTGSIAIGAGMDVSLNFDYDGNIRTVNAPSIGAFEYSYSPDVSTSSGIRLYRINNKIILYNNHPLSF